LWRRWFHGRLLALRSRHPDDVPPGVGGGLGCGLLLLPDRRRCYGGGGGCGDFRPRAFPMAMLSSGVALSSSWVVVVGRLLLVRAVSWLSSPVVAASGGEAILVLADQSILRVLGSSGRAVRRLCRCAGEASIGGAEVGSWSVGGVWLSCRCDSLSKDAGLLLPLRFRSESVVLSECADDAVGSRCRRRYAFIDLRSHPASGGSCGVKTFMAGVPVLLRRPVGMASSPASVCSGDGVVFCECTGVGLLVGQLCLSAVFHFFSEGLFVILCYE